MPLAAPSRAALLGGVYVSQGRYDEAAALFVANEAYFRDNEAYLRDVGHDDFSAIARFHLGLIAWVQGDDARARSLLRDAVVLYDRSGMPADAIDPLRYLGLIACAAGNLDDAARWFREELTRLRQYGSRAALAVGLADVATLAAAREAWQPAMRLFAKAEALLRPRPRRSPCRRVITTSGRTAKRGEPSAMMPLKRRLSPGGGSRWSRL